MKIHHIIVMALLMLGFVCLAVMPQEPVDEHKRVLVTAAHLELPKGYIKVFVDEEYDYAVYVQEDYASTACKVGDRVVLADSAGIVETVSDKEFTVEVDNISKVVPGVSGSPVLLDTRPIGFISGWSGEGAVRCIFY